jgi:hypothetical protein
MEGLRVVAPSCLRYWRRVRFEYARAICEYAWEGDESLRDGRAAAVRATRERLFDAHSHLTDVQRALFLGERDDAPHAHPR